MTSGAGTAAAVGIALEAADLGLEEPEQLELAALLGLPARRDQPLEEQRAEIERRGPGRPKGSRNKRTVATAEYLLARYRNPVEGLLQMGMVGVEELSKRLGCTPFEAWQEIRLCLGAAAPYVVQRQPIAVNLSERRTVRVSIVSEPAPAAPQSGGADLELKAKVIQPVAKGATDEV